MRKAVRKSDDRSGPVAKRIDAAFESLCRVVEIALSYAFLFAVALNFLTAVDRYIFKHSIIGSDEVQTYIMIWMTFVGAVIVSWRHRHLRMDVLLSRLPRSIRTVFMAAELCLIVVLTGVLATRSFVYAAQMEVLDRRSDLAGLPMWIPHSALFIGFALIALIALWRAIELFTGRAELEEHPNEAPL